MPMADDTGEGPGARFDLEPRAGETAPGPPITRAEWADRSLRGAILAGDLRPGEKLVAGDLARRFAVSATPLREALQRLAGEGLVEIRPQRGAIVAPVSPAEAREIYELRALLDPRALRDSVARSDAGHRAAVERAWVELAAARGRTPERAEDLLRTLEAHAAFHEALLSRCGSRWLRRLTAQLAAHAQRYALLAGVARDGRDPHHDVADEHAGLRDAVLAGDADRAARLLEAHLLATLAGFDAGQGASGGDRAERPPGAPR